MLKENSDVFTDYWLKVLKHNKITSMGVSETDEEALKSLVNVRIKEEKDSPEVGQYVSTITFEFTENAYFSNAELSKTFILNSEMLIERIESTPILWKSEPLNISKLSKKIRNIETGEVKEISREVAKESFFNFFFNYEGRKVSEISDMSARERNELGTKLDMEFEILMELSREIVPYSLDYFLGLDLSIENYCS